MKRALKGAFHSLLAAILLSIFADATASDYTTYELEFRPVSLTEAQAVVSRTIGSGTVDSLRWADLLDRTRAHVSWASEEWFDAHPNATIAGGVPFYGPRNRPVAFEYYIACGESLCGSLYDVFPDVTTIDDAMDLFYKWGHCLAAYDCGTGSNPTGSSLRTFFVPNAVPVSIRLADEIPYGRMKFYHGIYAIAEHDLDVVSLDPRDADLSRRELKRRLLGLADFGMASPGIPLVTARSRLRDLWPATVGDPTLDQSRASETAYSCTPFETSTTTRSIRVANGDGTFHEETVTSTNRPTGSLYAPECVGMPLIETLLYGHHAFVGIGIDYLTGRVGSSMYEMNSRLDTPL